MDLAIKNPNVVGAAGKGAGAKISPTSKEIGGVHVGGDNAAGPNTRNGKGAAELNAFENAAANADLTQNDDDLDGAREGEDNVNDMNYTGGGRERTEEKQGQNIFTNHKGATGVIIAIIMSIIGVVGFGQMSLPFSMIEELRMTFNTMQTSVSTRSSTLIKYQIDTGLMKSPTKPKLFGGEKFSLSNKQKTKLAKQGIGYDSSLKAMTFVDANGKQKFIVADDSYKTGVKNRVGDTGDVITIKEAFDTDVDFFRAYKEGSMTWRGAIANWFESNTLKFLQVNNLNRNTFDNFNQRVQENGGDVDSTMKEVMAKGTEEISDGGKTKYSKDSKEEVDSDGKKATTAKYEQEVESSARVRTDSEVDFENRVKANVDADSGGDSGGGISGTVQTITSSVCAVADTIGAITLLVSASEILQTVHLATAYLEAIDKVKAGNGDDVLINELTNALTNPTTNTHYSYDVDQSKVTYLSSEDTKGLSGYSGTEDSEAVANKMSGTMNTMNANAKSITMSTSTTTKPATEANGFVSMYKGTHADPNDPSVKSFNFSGNIKRIMGGLGVSMASFNTCSIAKMVANGAGAIEGFVNVGSCILGAIGAPFTFGASTTLCGGLVFQVVSGVALSTAIGGLITAVISAVVPMAAKLFTRNLISNLGGEDLGNALVSGSHSYLGNVHRYNGGSLSNLSTYTSFAMAQKEVIAEEARYERLVHSPFDASSQYTFMGTLLKQFSGFIGTNSLMSGVVSSGNVLGNSIAAILPTASAIDVSSTVIDNYDEVCPYLASIDAVGDAYCVPYTVSDMSTMSMDPSQVVEAVKDDLMYMGEDGKTYGCGNAAEPECPAEVTDPNGSGMKIKGNSGLAKYISFCDNRSSSFGIMDTNIANSLSSWGNVPVAGALGGAINGGIGAIPAVGDVIDVVDNALKLANYGYIFGQSCVAGNTADALSDGKQYEFAKESNKENVQTGSVEIKNPSWENKARFYQRFIEDQSYIESAGIIEKSAVTAFIEEYELENPVDTSYEGILARYSGLSKDKVVATLDIIDDALFLAKYEPLERYIFGQDIRPNIMDRFKYNDSLDIAYVVLLNTIEFADVRNRSFVV